MFPFSQVVDGTQPPKIFYYSSGLPMEIFVDAGVVSSRPKLMRILRRSGASICKNIALAQIILVDAATNSGRQFIRDWGQTKLVLEYLWARKSVDANRALMDADDWGGYRTIDDGRPIETDGGDADYEDSKTGKLKSPLPTPRPSPLEPSPSSQVRDPSQVRDSRVSRPSSSAPARSVASHSVPPHVEKGRSNGLYHGYDVPVSSQYSTQFQPQLVSMQLSQPHPASSRPTHHFSQSQPNGGHPTQHFVQSQPVKREPAQHFAQSPHVNGNPMQQHFTQSQPTMHHFPQSPSTGSHPMQHFPRSLPPGNNNNLMHNFSQHQGNSMPQLPQPSHIHPMQTFSQPQHNAGNTMIPQGFMNAIGPSDGQNIMQSIFDVMRHQGINPMNAGSLFGPMFMGPSDQFLPNMSQPTLYSQPQMDAMMQPPEQQSHVFSNTIDANPNVISSASVLSPTVKPNSLPSQLDSPSHQTLDRSSLSPTPSASSSSFVVSSPPPPRSKGKRKAVSPARSCESESSSAVEPLLTQLSAESFSVPSTPSKVHPKVGSPRLPSKVFTTTSGEPLSFFVQVDLRPRLPVITKIKKNGGVLDSSHINADYAILYRNSTSFNALLTSRISAEKPAVGSAFVDDCVEEEALLDPTTYEFERFVSGKRKGGKSPSGAEKAKRRKQEAERKKQERKMQESGQKKEKKVKVEEEHRSPGPPSPTPPPENTKVLFRGGHYSFSEPERAFFSRYVWFLLDRDPLMPNTAIGQAMHKKMPHHSSLSWGSFISQSARDEVDAIRKKVGIARRKAESAVQARQPPSDHRGADSSKKKEPSPPQAVQGPNLEEQDLECICQFFAKGGNDDDDDEHIWSLLATHQECKSAATWLDFYESHHDQVNAGIKQLYDAVEALSAGPSADPLRPKMEEVVWK